MEKTFNISGMHCAGCKNSVEKAISSVDEVENAVVNLATETAVIEFDGSDETIKIIEKKVNEAGYQLKKKVHLNQTV